MKLEKKPQMAVETVGNFDSQEFDIPQEEVGMLLTVLADGIYSDKIGSPIREVVSNAYDAQVENGNPEDPIMVGIHYDDGETLFKVKDVGIGMSPDRIHNIFTKYFKSTKRDSNDQIGGFGLGAKSPLTYADTFFVTTIFDNVKYNYAVHKADSETMKPSMKLLYEEPTDEPTGTEVSFHIEDVEDIPTFTAAVRRQLLYFPNIYYINCHIENDYRIYEGKSFLFTDQFGDQLGDATEAKQGNQNIAIGINAGHIQRQVVKVEEGEYQAGDKILQMPYKNMHLSIGNVAYPLDFRLVGIDDISLPIALKFKVGEITVNTSRESIEYTKKSIEVIQKRHQEFLAEIAKLWKKQLGDGVDDVLDYIETCRTFKPILKLGRAKINLEVLSSFLEFNKTTWKHAPKISHDRIISIYNGAVMHWKDIYEDRAGHAEDMANKHITNLINDYDFRKRAFLVEQYFRLDTAPRTYLYETVNDHAPVLFYLYSMDPEIYFESRFKAEDNNVSDKALKLLIDGFKSLFRSQEEITPPQAWLDEFRLRGKPEKVVLPYDVILHQLAPHSWAQVVDGDEVPTFRHSKVKVKNMRGRNARQVWGLQSEKDKLATAKNILCYNKAIKRALTSWSKPNDAQDYTIQFVAEDKAYIMFNLPNAIHVDDLLNGTDRVVGNIATAIKYRERIRKFGSIELDGIYDHINDKISYLEEFIGRNYDGCDDGVLRGIEADDNFKDEFIEIVEAAGRINREVEAALEEVEAYMVGVELLYWIDTSENGSKLHVVKYLQAMHKHVNIEYYEGRDKSDTPREESTNSVDSGEEVREESVT